MITRNDFEKIIQDVEHGIDYEFLLMVRVGYHYRRSLKFKDQDKTALAQAEADKGVSIIDYIQAFNKYNKLMEE